MNDRPQFEITLSSPAERHHVLAVELPYDADSPFTWIEPEQARGLKLPLYREKRITLPGSTEVATVSTVIARVTTDVFDGVDELVIAPHPGFARLGFRTLFALQARVEQINITSIATSQENGQLNESFILVPFYPVEPYSALCERGWPKGGVPEDLLKPINRDLLARSTLALRYFVLCLIHEPEISSDIIARALFRTVSRLLACSRVAVLTRSLRTGDWTICLKTPQLPRERALKSLLSFSHSGANPDRFGKAVISIFPTNRRSFVSDSQVGFYIEPDTAGQHHFIKRLLPVLGSVLDLLLMQSEVTQALWSTRRQARVLLAYPGDREDLVSYHLLDRAKRALNDWSHLSFWRTSRTTGYLEKTAEHQPQHRAFQRDTIAHWKDIGPHETTKASHGQPHDKPALIAIGVPSNLAVDEVTSAIITQVLGVSHPLSVRCETKSQASFRVFLSLDKQREPHDGDASYLTAAIEPNLRKLFNRLSLSGSEIVVLLWSYLPAARDTGLPEGFHVIIALVSNAGQVRRIRAPALAALRRSLSLHLQHYNTLSWSRYRLRVIEDFLSGIFSADDRVTLSERLERTLFSLIHTKTFAVLERPTGKVILASSHLDSWLGKTIPLPELTEDAAKTYRDILSTPLFSSSLIAALPVQPDPSTKPGGILSVISETSALLVIKHGKEGWKITSTEYSCVRVLSTALQLAKPLAADGASSRSRQPIDWFGGSYELLITKQVNVPGILDQLIEDLERNLRALHTSHIDCAAMLLGVDGQTVFCRAIAGGMSSDAVPLQVSSMVGYALKAFRESSQPFTCLLGVVGASGDSVDLLGPSSAPSGVFVKFHHLVPGNPGDLVAAKGFTRSSGLPLGFLVIRLGTMTDVEGAGCLPEAQALIDAAADYAALILQRQIELRTAQMRLAMEAPIRRLKMPHNPTLTKHSEIQSKDQRTTGHLPAPLRRIFTAEYCTSLHDILATALSGTQVFSLSCRIRYPGSDGIERLWKLAAAGDAESRDAYEFAPGSNVHSYLCRDELPRRTDGLERVFLPDVHNIELNKLLYPGLTYLDVHSRTETELCFGFAILGIETYYVTFNIEGPSFFHLWLVEEFFRQMATTLADEVALHYRRAEANDRNMMELGTLVAWSMRHSVEAEMRRSLDPTAFKAVSLELDVAEGLEGKSYSGKEIGQSINDGVRAFAELRPEVTVEQWNNHSSSTSPSAPNIPAVFSRLLTKVLLEQCDTLTRIALPPTRTTFLICWRLVNNKRHTIIDIFNNVPPRTEECRRLAESLFWYKIDDEGREGKGRSGKGLYLLGHMLRSIGCRPCVRSQPASSTLADYPSERAEDIRARMTGFALELRFPVVHSDITLPSG